MSFTYDGKNVCLVEIDQLGLPRGYSTYLLISWKSIGDDIAKSVEKDYVVGKALVKTQIELKSENIILESKHHPRSNSADHQKAWRNRVLDVIAACKSV